MRKPSVFGALPGALLAVFTTTAALTHISPAVAQEAAAPAPPSKETKAAARAAYGAGEAAYQSGDFATAHEKFSEANSLIPNIHAQYWVAMSLAGMGKTAEAYEALSTALDDPGASRLGAEKITAGQDKLAELEKVPAAVAVTSEPPGATIELDGNASGTTPGSVEMPRGKHTLKLSMEGYDPITVDLDVKPGEQSSQELTLQQAAPPPEPEPEPEAAPAPAAPPEPRSKLPAYITLGVAGASAIVGTIFGLKALSSASDFKDNPTTATADDAERSALISDMAFGVTLTLGITGIVLLTADDESELSSKHSEPKTRLQVAPYAGPKGGGASARLTF
jgi:hypothetical protein